MQKQKHMIEYQRDQSLQSMRASYYNDVGANNNKLQASLQNAQLGKRNKYHDKAKDLQKIIFKYKVHRLVQNFVKKLRLNSVYRKPSEIDEQKQEKQQYSDRLSGKIYDFFLSLIEKNGINIGNLGVIIWSLINVVQITFMVFIFSITMAFSETQDYPLFLYCRTFSVFLYILDMILNFTVKRYEGGKQMQKIKQISRFYLRNGFAVDLISILIFPIDLLISSKNNITIVISFVAIIKLVNNIKKLQKFEYLLIASSEKERYYGLIKVILTNFVIGHFLSILLNLMANIDYTQNWKVKFGISNAEWYVQYVWGYYWGTNIMLTVGFGDITATNYYQAIVLIFIQTFSCITLAYNINYVGALINSIRQNQQQKKKKLKVFHRMCKQNFVSNQMQSKITNFIQESYRIKQSFQYDAHDEVLKSLPKILEREYRKQANKTLFDNIGFLNNLSKKTLIKLAEQISRKICHPEEVVVRKGGVSDFMILQNGCLSLTCKIHSQLEGRQIQVIQVKQGQKPKILSLDFIKNKTVNYNIKSNTYSVLYYLCRQDLMEALRSSSQMDFQMFCMLKDKDNNQFFQNNLYFCSICKDQYHTKFQCNRLHFVPLRRKVILKQITQVNRIKQVRSAKFNRRKIYVYPTFIYELLKKDQKKFIEDQYDDEHYEQIQNIRNFYTKVNKQVEVQTQNDTIMKQKTMMTQIMNSNKFNFKGLFDERALRRLEQILENKTNKFTGFWEFQVDQAENFNFYFSEGNPEYLKKNKKTKRKKGIFNVQL